MILAPRHNADLKRRMIVRERVDLAVVDGRAGHFTEVEAVQQPRERDEHVSCREVCAGADPAAYYLVRLASSSRSL